MDAQLDTNIVLDILYIYVQLNSITLPNLDIFMYNLILQATH